MVCSGHSSTAADDHDCCDLVERMPFSWEVSPEQHILAENTWCRWLWCILFQNAGGEDLPSQNLHFRTQSKPTTDIQPIKEHIFGVNRVRHITCLCSNSIRKVPKCDCSRFQYKQRELGLQRVSPIIVQVRELSEVADAGV